MQKILLVVDMQNDFIDGALGTAEAEKIVPLVKEKIEGFDGTVLFTRDTHFDNYMETQEGKRLPVPHCIKGTEGWQIRMELDALRTTEAIDKLTFGSSELGQLLVKKNEEFFVSFSEYPKLGSLEFSQLTFFTEETDGVLYWESVDVTVTLAK